ncbi:MAG: hypothetical protein WB767_09695 [Nocardioides sp.]
MNVEIGLSDGHAKRRVLATLVQLGYRAAPGCVRLAYPFTVVVEGVADEDVPDIESLVLAADPGARGLSGVGDRSTAAR